MPPRDHTVTVQYRDADGALRTATRTGHVEAREKGKGGAGIQGEASGGVPMAVWVGLGGALLAAVAGSLVTKAILKRRRAS